MTQPSPPTTTPEATTTADPSAVAPHELLEKISATELGRAFVERAYYQVLAERYAAELERLRREHAATPDQNETPSS